jgi:VWFA-related protein
MRIYSRSNLPILLLGLILCSSPVRAQSQNQKPSQQLEDILRINTELVQTGVTVLDKQGRFIDGLRRDQFELTVDGKPQPISFFEQVRTGSTRERAQFALLDRKSPREVEPATSINEVGRIIVFFVDDLHLSLDSLGRTRRMLAQFIENEMNDNDRVAIASTSGDVGFLQQFTDSKSVLKAAAGRLTHHPYNTRDMADVTTPMTEFMALTIERKDDPGVLDFYIEECLRQAYPLKYTRAACEVEVKNRARLTLLQAGSVTLNTYASLESLMRSSSLLPGRKLVFFISDGFLLDTGPRNADPRGRLSQITDGALRAGVVIYTIDARGLFSGQLDATNNIPFDRENRLESASLREAPASQDALNALASDTGGRALRNQNYFDRWVNKILAETSDYYLLAWRPNNQEQTAGAFKSIAVSIIDHPEYTVRLPRGFLRANAAAPPKSSAAAETPLQPHQELQQALTSLRPKREIPNALSVIYLDTPEHGPVITASVQIANHALTYEAVDGKQLAAVEVAGVIVNDHGKPAASFQTRLSINAQASQSGFTIYNYRAPISPGLYQVRIATRDNKSGQVGSAQQWIEIPNLALKRLSASSLILGVQNVGLAPAGGGGTSQVQFSVDHRFARNGRLRFITFIYNAAPGLDGKSTLNISLQVRILRNGQIVRTLPLQRVIASPDLARIPWESDVLLETLPPGEFTLEVTVTDEIAKMSASQQTRIVLE